jgi:NADH-quinone oxidoreductase subunit G
LNLALGDNLTVSTDTGSLTLPMTLVDIADDVVWLPEHGAGTSVRRALGVGHGGVVRLQAGPR